MSEKDKFLKALKANEGGIDTHVVEQLVMRMDALEIRNGELQNQIDMLKHQLTQFKRNRDILR